MLEYFLFSSVDFVCGVGIVSVILYVINCNFKSGVRVKIFKIKFYMCIVIERDGSYLDCIRINFKLFGDIFNKVKNLEKI